jgi:hypothetical protein
MGSPLAQTIHLHPGWKLTPSFDRISNLLQGKIFLHAVGSTGTSSLGILSSTTYVVPPIRSNHKSQEVAQRYTDSMSLQE